jgi:hypothetical protein
MKKILFFLFFLTFISFNYFCQDYDRILKELPPVGSYAEYKMTKIGSKETTESRVKVSVTRKQVIDKEEYDLVEISPFTFKAMTVKSGTLGILLKKNASDEEKKNFILRAKKVYFAPEGKDPYEVDESVLHLLTLESNDVKYTKEEKEEKREVVEFKDKIKREVITLNSHIIFEEKDGDRKESKGTIKISKDIPFQLISEDFIEKKIGKNGELKRLKENKIELIDFSFSGAKSSFPENNIKKKGVWGIIFS